MDPDLLRDLEALAETLIVLALIGFVIVQILRS